MAVTADDIAQATGLDATRAASVLAAVTALVEKYAPDGPEAVKDEATIRCAGWLAQSPAAAVRSETEGDVSTAFAPSMTGAMQASGAKGLLSPWRVRRAGAA